MKMKHLVKKLVIKTSSAELNLTAEARLQKTVTNFSQLIDVISYIKKIEERLLSNSTY